MAQECPDCGKLFSSRTCSCGFSPKALAARARAGRCPYDGTWRESSGFCKRGGGYPQGTPCPFACPVCRKPLDWSGGCIACHGITTGAREDWTYPGDGYYTHAVDGTPIGDGQHWVKRQGPRRACDREENRDGARAIAKILRAPVRAAMEKETP